MTVRMIFSRSSNGYIGKDNQLLFSIPEDMAEFKRKTQGHTVVMGRKTWESIPPKFRPLPNRRNIVITSSQDVEAFAGATVMRSLDEVFATYQDIEDITLIGGESIYQEGMSRADEIHETLVTKAFDGDARAPFIDPQRWMTSSSSAFKTHNELNYQFNTYVRK